MYIYTIIGVLFSSSVLVSTPVLISGTASEVAGMDSETVFKNTVSERRIVTSENKNKQGRWNLEKPQNVKPKYIEIKEGIWREG